ncbi:LPXTG cell wall anchor domain-containing protein [Enterococcus sp. BWR-S5]|uniref:LPXTG cell wall anchor domain-containing protein n=1 Tax=Enterococcus sp. BWR-S5 TaxID=2787714 RepID=UPI001922426B|nr:LPXTG cell wall anchor domain-containing protein [Enterococcus sp. BWR-S5]MBL1224041.1 LPXTG cell wall anchor domain-containing protein [Enterococcus sp. BWR-S5]
MKNKLSYLLLSALLVMIMGGSGFQPVNAEGGAVQTNGQITFFDETTESSDSTETSGSQLPDTETSGSKLPDTIGGSKPEGKYPSTGDLFEKSLSISGGIILGAVLLFALFRKIKGVEK